MNKFAVYTALFGDRDAFKAPLSPLEDCDLFLFIDQSFSGVPDCVTVVHMDPPIPGDPVRSSKHLKIRPDIYLPSHDITLWVDGSARLTSLQGITKFVEFHDIAFFTHMERNCIYDEAKACIGYKLDDPQVIDEQMARYREEGYPEGNGLIAGGGILRKNTPALTAFNEEWWEGVKNGSRRDQLSCNYALWKTKTPRAVLDDGNGGDIQRNKWWYLEFTSRRPLPAPTPFPPA